MALYLRWHPLQKKKKKKTKQETKKKTKKLVSNHDKKLKISITKYSTKHMANISQNHHDHQNKESLRNPHSS